MTTQQLKAKYRYLAARDRHVRMLERYRQNQDSVWTKMSHHHSGSNLWKALDACYAAGLGVDRGMPFVLDVPLR